MPSAPSAIAAAVTAAISEPTEQPPTFRPQSCSVPRFIVLALLHVHLQILHSHRLHHLHPAEQKCYDSEKAHNEERDIIQQSEQPTVVTRQSATTQTGFVL